MLKLEKLNTIDNDISLINNWNDVSNVVLGHTTDEDVIYLIIIWKIRSKTLQSLFEVINSKTGYVVTL